MNHLTRLTPLLALLAWPSFAQDRPGLPKLPQPITSFGAAVWEDQVYVYGGHIGEAHDHSAKNLSAHFVRLDMKKAERGGTWEPLPMGQKVQGLAMVAWNGAIIRLGGVEARNEPDKETDMHSLPSVVAFNPKGDTWRQLTPLPEPRSSFDAVVVDDHVYVIGGWALSGNEKSGKWAENNYVADLRQNPIKWEALPAADFRQRALAVAAVKGHIYAIGGLTPEGKPTSAVHVYDIAAKTWSKGPDFPATGRHAAFGISAYGVDGAIWASAADGKVFSIEPGQTSWKDSGHTLRTPRFFHRILPTSKGSLLFIGGASRTSHLETVESVDLSMLKARPLESLQPAPVKAEKATGQNNWPAFRNGGTNQTSARNLPLTWSDSQNLAWTATVEGYGQSSPVVWGDKVFVTSIEGPSKEKLHVTCFDLKSGAKSWQKTFAPSQNWQVSDYVSKSSPTPTVDADRVYAFFETGDLVALDHKGEVAWQRSLVKEYGEFKGNHGVGTSLAQDDKSLYLAIEHGGPSYLLALDKANGKNRWKTDHDSRVAWSTPLVTSDALILSASGSVESYDLATGKLRWSVGELSGNNVPSPTPAGELFLIGSTDRDNNIAVTADGKVAWRAAEATSSFSSPVVVGDAAYFVNKAGVVFCHDVKTGKARWSLRLPDSCWATPVPTPAGIYFFSKNGATTVLRDGPEGPEKVSESKLTVSGRVYGVAAVDSSWLIRTGDRLICVRGS